MLLFGCVDGFEQGGSDDGSGSSEDEDAGGQQRRGSTVSSVAGGGNHHHVQQVKVTTPSSDLGAPPRRGSEASSVGVPPRSSVFTTCGGTTARTLLSAYALYRESRSSVPAFEAPEGSDDSSMEIELEHEGIDERPDAPTWSEQTTLGPRPLQGAVSVSDEDEAF